MRQDTAIITTKGICYWLIGTFTPWGAALAQWANSGESPSMIVWLGIILPLSIVGGATQLLSFLSGSYGEYRKSKESIKAVIDAGEMVTKKQQIEDESSIQKLKTAARAEEAKAELKAATEAPNT